MCYAPQFLAAVVVTSAATVSATPFATEVVSYTPGVFPSDALDPYVDPSAALGKTAEFNPAFPDFNVPESVVTPFNATYTTGDLVALGNGGSLVLRLGQPAGDALGVHTGVGLIDTDFPNGNTGATATPYTQARIGGVRVSQDGVTFVDVAANDTSFDVPTNWYAQGVTAGGAFDGSDLVEADFGQVFDGTLSDFDNQNWAGVLDVLGGSAGGTWIDLTGTGLSEINFVEFYVDGPDQALLIDAVAIVPEPAGLALLGLAGAALLRRRA